MHKLEEYGLAPNRKPFYIWNTIMLLDTIGQYFLFFVYVHAWETGYVMPREALVMGSLLSFVFIISLCKRGTWDVAVVKLNALYWIFTLIAAIADGVLYWRDPTLFCVPEPTDLDTCNYVYRQLYITWAVLFVGLLIWAKVIRRLNQVLGIKNTFEKLNLDDMYNRK